MDFNLSVTNVLEQCRNDATIYTIFQLDTAFNLTSDIENWQVNFDINGIIEDVRKQVNEELDKITNNFDISMYEDQIDDLSKLLNEMEAYIKSDILAVKLDAFFNVNILDEIKTQIEANLPEYVDQIDDIIAKFNDFNATFEAEKKNFQYYLDNDLSFEVS